MNAHPSMGEIILSLNFPKQSIITTYILNGMNSARERYT